MSELAPNNPIIQKATLQLGNLRGVDESAVATYAEKLDASAAPVLEARADIIFVVIYGNLTVKIRSDPYKAYYYDVDSWGLGAAGGTSIGMMYTAYDNWDAFFRNVTAYHAQGIAEGGGILQVNWFISNGTPVGQYNGAMAGAGGLEAGGPGKWQK